MAVLDSLRLSTSVIPVAILLALVVVLQRYFAVSRDAREPPFVPSRIPVVGHLLSILQNGSKYFSQLEARSHQGMYTLPILSGRMYIAASPDWAIAVYRAHKTLFFNTLIARAIETLFCFDQATMDLINYNLNGENGTRDGIILEIHDMMQVTLAPGPHLDNLNQSILDHVTPDMNALARGGPQQIPLWRWIRDHFTIASTAALYGPNHPFKQYPDCAAAFWDFEADAMALSMMPLPHLLARKGHAAREQVFAAFRQYVQAEGYKDAGTSQLVQNRAQVNLGKFGMSKEMVARGEVSLLFGAVVNTIPTTFWLISRIFADAQLLAEIREEIDKCHTASASSPHTRTMNVAQLKSACPLFSATLRETLRTMASVNSNRIVAEDTTVTNHITGESYLLKKDSIVQIASNVIHFQALWGTDADSFNPRRFLTRGKSEASAGRSQDPAAPFRDSEGKVHGSAFRSFGGGGNVCPGRYFAQTEIMGLASLFIAGFEMEGGGQKGRYSMPAPESYNLSMSATKPAKDVDVVLTRRRGYEDVEWELRAGGGTVR